MRQRPCPVCDSCDAHVIMNFSPDLLAEVNRTYDLKTLKEVCEGIEDHITYSRCDRCGMVYCQNVWDDAILARVYEDTIDHTQSKAKTTTLEKRMYVVRIWLNILRVLRINGTDIFEDFKLIDFGCGWGDFLDVADGYGVTAIGYDTDRRKTALAVERGHRIVSTLDELRSAGPFDVFVMNSVLEHLFDVSELMNLAREILKPRGLFVSTVMDYRRGFIRRNCRRLKNGLPASTKNLNPLEHVNVYDYRSSLATLQKYGFEFFSTGHALNFVDMPGLRGKTGPLRTANRIEALLSKIFTSRGVGITVYALNGRR